MGFHALGLVPVVRGSVKVGARGHAGMLEVGESGNPVVSLPFEQNC
jgi:hypothetical protein